MKTPENYGLSEDFTACIQNSKLYTAFQRA
jgi:hypothetical protein